MLSIFCTNIEIRKLLQCISELYLVYHQNVGCFFQSHLCFSLYLSVESESSHLIIEDEVRFNVLFEFSVKTRNFEGK